MIPQWTNHLKDPKEKKKFEEYIKGCKTLLEREMIILEGMEAELDEKETSETQYDSPAWAALQADRNGYRRALRRVKKLITLDQRNTNEPV